MKSLKTKGFSAIILIAILAVLALGGGYWVWKDQAVAPAPAPADTNIEPPSSSDNSFTTAPVPTPDIDTSDWKTYRNEEYGFEFKYPNNWYLIPAEIPNALIVRLSSLTPLQFNDGTDKPRDLFRVSVIDSSIDEANWAEGFGGAYFRTSIQNGLRMDMSSISSSSRATLDQIFYTLQFIKEASPNVDHERPYQTRSDGSKLEFPLIPISGLYKLSSVNYVTSAMVRGWVDKVEYNNVGGRIFLTDKMGNYTRADIAHAFIGDYISVLSKLKKGDKIEVFGVGIYGNLETMPNFGLTGSILVLSD